MFKTVLTTLAIAISVSAFGASKAATEDWVKNYVANQAAAVAASMTTIHSNGVTQVSAWENGTNMVVTIEDPSHRALVLFECAEPLPAQGITNEMIFAYASGGLFRSNEHTIQATSTNLVLNGIYHSLEDSGSAYFVDSSTNRLARVSSLYIQPSMAEKLGVK